MALDVRSGVLVFDIVSRRLNQIRDCESDQHFHARKRASSLQANGRYQVL